MPARVEGADPLGRAIVLTPLVAATFLSKLAVPPLGERGLGLLFPLTALALVAGLVTGRLRFAPGRLAVFLSSYTCLVLLQLLDADRSSFSSLAMMGLLGLAFTAESGSFGASEARRVFSTIAIVIATLGIAQFLVQFLTSAAAMFPIETLIPPSWRTQRYNNIIPLHWGATVHKANGVVMLEPSDFSQLCAVGIVNELSGKFRAGALALLGAALLTSYSGTGLVVLAVAIPVFVVLQRRFDLILYGVFALGVLLVFAEPLHLDVIATRAHEFDSSESSGYARFVAWRELFAARLWPEPVATWFGTGAGSFGAAAAEYRAAEMVFSKILYEFGLLGGLAYFGFVLYCLLGSAAPPALRVAVAVAYFMNGAYSPWFTGLALSVLLWPTPTAGWEGRARPVEPRPLAARRAEVGLS